MLVIRRKVDEAVVIGADIEITVIDITGSRVKLGIQAPAAVSILRKEIQLAARENQAAAEGVSTASVGRLVEALRQREPAGAPTSRAL